jgi:UPF0755 protein
MKKLITIASVLVLVCVLSAIGAYMYWQKSCKDFLQDTMVSGEYAIEQGSSYSEIYKMLFSNLETPYKFNYYLTRVAQIDRKLHYGYYEADNISLDALLANITSGKETLTRVTFPEGYNMYDIAKTIDKAGIATYDEMLTVFTDRAFVETLVGNSYESLEGFLMPGTYLFQKKHSPKGIAQKMVADFYASLPADFEAKVAKQGLSFYDAVNLAAIVQKETYNAKESPIVASVYLNRIKINMRLQADPTIIYGIYEKYDGDIKFKDIRDPSNRFNTYVINGLPPTPIANPSAMALDAVANPAKTNYYYFVASRDGEHLFANSYAEHQQNVRIHQQGGSK